MDRYVSSLDQGYRIFVEKYLNQVDLAHLVELTYCGHGGRPGLEQAISWLRTACRHEFPLETQATTEDVFDSRIKALTAKIGQGTEWLTFERSRREAINVAFYMSIRDQLLTLIEKICDLLESGITAANRYANYLMPDHTYNQQAQVTTLGYFLNTILEQAKRDVTRLRACWAGFDKAPIGIGIMNGSNIPLDRQRLSKLLGFSGPVAQCRDAVWGADLFIEFASSMSACSTNLGRFCEDLMELAHDPNALLEVPAPLSRASRIMPHKKNPYAYASARAIVSMVNGYALAIFSGQRTPSHQVDNRLVAYEGIPRMLSLTTELLQITNASMKTIEPDQTLLSSSIHEAATASTLISSYLVRECGFTPHEAYSAVAQTFAGKSRQRPKTISEILLKIEAIAKATKTMPSNSHARIKSLTNESIERQITEMNICLQETHAMSAATRQWIQSCREHAADSLNHLLKISQGPLA